MPILVIIIIIIVIYLWNVAEEAKRKNKLDHEMRIAKEKADQILLNQIYSILPHIRSEEKRFSSRLENYRSGYFTYYELDSWKRSVNGLYQVISKNSFKNIGLNGSDVGLITRFEDYYKNGDHYRNDYTTHFINYELSDYRTFFDNVEGRKLDAQQRHAIVKDEDNNIIIAGAGSGKTTTIVGKVNYILDRYKVDPQEILLISFTNKSASTLVKRISIPGLDVKTFHKFSLEVIRDTENNQPSIFDDAQYSSLITGFFQELLTDQKYLGKTTSFFKDFLKPAKPAEDFKDQGAYFQYLKDLNFATYKLTSLEFRGKQTYKREVVKSIEECKIANFLLFNNVEYLYEAPYEYDTATKEYRQYKPDFKIRADKKVIYLEHFAINKNGQVPHFFADLKNGETVEQATRKYFDGIKWKREVHAKNSTCLLETYSHEMFDNILFENLTKKLGEAGIKLRPKSPQEIWGIIIRSANDEVQGVITLFQTFITLMKSNNYSIRDVVNINDNIKDEFYQKRNKLFLEIVGPVYELYQNYLRGRNEIDFSDMINKAVAYISSRKYKRKLSYIIIDEFQDISIGRYQLIKALKEINPACKLFCVGDDWQSIYRFAGSDISLFKEFEKYFGITETSKIETTYRFKNPLLEISSKFILKNPNQSFKQLREVDGTNLSRHKIIYSNSEHQDDDTEALVVIFNELKLISDIMNKEILLLGRYKFDFKRIKNQEQFFEIDNERQTLSYSFKTERQNLLHIQARFMTVHNAKGLEADIVIVINCNSGKFGFPSGISDDTVLNLLLTDADQFENGEERRLFYVALTRAKETVYLISDNSYKSKFIAELETEDQNNQIKKCPRCVTADLIKRSGSKNGKNWSFWGCSNFNYGCNYQEWIN
jgi:DNA helicase IV